MRQANRSWRVLGVQLLGLRDRSPGLVTALAVSAMVSGLLTASILLILFSVPCLMLFDVLLGALFLQVAGRIPAR